MTKQLTLAEKWAKEEEMFAKGEWSLFGLRAPKTPEAKPTSAISPKTNELLGKLKKKR